MEKENNLPSVTPTRQLPKLEELHHDLSVAVKEDKFLTLVNQPVPPSWIKEHPFAKMKNEKGEEVPLKYLPVDKVEYLLTRIFQDWRREIISVQQVFQSVVVVVRLHLQHPITGEWYYHDGVGASPVQTDKGASAADLGKIKNAAVQMAAPAAASYALKDAAENIGVLFGKDISRRQTLQFQPQYETMWTRGTEGHQK